VASKIATRFRARGPGELAALAWSRLKEAISSQNTLIVLARDAVAEPAVLSGFELREARPEEGPAYARDVGTDSPRTFRGRLTENTRCFVVVHEGRFVHATWMTARAAWTREIRRYVLPPAGDAYVYESFTHPSVRGRGVYPFALKGIAAALSRRGLRRVWVAVEKHNPPSLKAVEKAGFAPEWEISYRRRLGTLKLETAPNPSQPVPALSRTLEH
jgi:RimJ/RimL family protein N-acetyltransferase